jgi:hypothetical protein|tara:strand:+ start:1070 stop:1510 length:441 start_codon:yes stop_codon:yes gene_type:complete
MKKLVVIMLGFVMMGCVNKTDLVVEDLEKSDNSSLEVLVEKIELPEPKGWTESNTGFWKAMFWYRMAQDMQIRMVYTPEQVYNIASCVVDTYRQMYEYDVFQKEIGNRKTPLPPNLTAEAMAFGTECTKIEQFKIKQKQLNPKESV